MYTLPQKPISEEVKLATRYRIPWPNYTTIEVTHATNRTIEVHHVLAL